MVAISQSQQKLAQSLKLKKYRQKHGLFLAEGAKIVQELLSSQYQVHKLYATLDWFQENQAAIAAKKIDCQIINERELKKVSQLSTANAAVALVLSQNHDLPKLCSGKSLLLDGLQDPGNLGTIIRIADWFGIDRIIGSMTSADPFQPKVVQATMGSLFRVKYYRSNIEEFIEQHSELPCYAADLDGVNLHEIAFSEKEHGLLVIGNESRGVSGTVRDLVGTRVTIPGRGKAESLNAGVATGIICAFWCK